MGIYFYLPKINGRIIPRMRVIMAPIAGYHRKETLYRGKISLQQNNIDSNQNRC